MALPKPGELSKAERISPEKMIWYGFPKSGKSTLAALLTKEKKALIIDLERGYSKLEAVKVSIDSSKDSKTKWEEFFALCKEVYLAGYDKVTKTYKPVYDIIIIDNISKLNEWSETTGTVRYMSKAQGKLWNRKIDSATNKPIPLKDAKGAIIKDAFEEYKPSDKEWESVHEVGQGYGYKHSRDEMVEMYNKVVQLAPTIIFIAHTRDKLASENLSEEVSTKELGLTGKLRDILVRDVDTVMYGFRDGDDYKVSFSNEDGSRCSYLSQQVITLGEKKDGKIISHWDKIFVD